MMRLGTALYWCAYLGIFLTGTFRIAGKLYVSHLIFFALTGIALLNRLIQGRIGLPKDLFILFGLFVTALVGTLYLNANGEAARYAAQLMIFYVAIFFPYLSFVEPSQIRNWFFFTNLGCAFNALAGLIQSVLWIQSNGFVFLANGKFFRVMGLCTSPADYAMGLMVGLYMANFIPRPRLRVFALSGYGFLLLASMSRSALVILFLALAMHFLSGIKEKSRLRGYLLGGACVLAALIYTGAFEVVWSRIGDIGNMNYNIKRLVTYQDVITKVFSGVTSTLFGNGFGTYSFYHPVDMMWYDNPHNVYLYLLYCMGLIGTVIFFGGMAFLIAKSASILSRLRENPRARSMITMVLLIHLCTWLVAMVETNISGIGSCWLLGSLFGIPLAIGRAEGAECIS